MLKHLSLLCACLLFPILVTAEPAAAPPGDDVAKFTGARTKVVWTRSTAWTDEDIYFQPRADLMCIDTAEGKERVLLPGGAPVAVDDGTTGKQERAGRGCHYRPSITPDGNAVVYNEMTSNKVDTSLIRVVDWDGKNDRPSRSVPGAILRAWPSGCMRRRTAPARTTTTAWARER
ncbi:MAG TPA: hypothetical protein VM223_21445 [Planctomycetota bacterium]|nr:hypothetical protein [Planctomycetota bacterium]